MTATLVSIALVFAPQQSLAPASPSVGVEGVGQAAVVLFAAAPDTQWTDMALSLTVDPSPDRVVEQPARQTEPPPELSLRERALNRFVELGAPPWVVGAFDCIGWYESKWQNVRSRTGDTGVLQINDVHRPELRAWGLDPWVPEDAATWSWHLFTRAGWSFRDWTVRGLCGLR